jgi:hypothetical protein
MMMMMMMMSRSANVLLSGGLLMMSLFCSTLNASFVSGSGHSLQKDDHSFARQTQEATDDQSDNSDFDDSRRVLINPFSVTFSGTSEPFTDMELNLLHNTLEGTILGYILNLQEVANVEYVLLGDISSTMEGDNIAKIYLKTGKALFGNMSITSINENVPDEATLNTWVGEAVDTLYQMALQQGIYNFTYVTQAKYAANMDSQDTDVAVEEEAAMSNSTLGIVVGVTILTVLLVAGAMAFLLIHKDTKTSEGEEKDTDDEDGTVILGQTDASTGAVEVSLPRDGESCDGDDKVDSDDHHSQSSGMDVDQGDSVLEGALQHIVSSLTGQKYETGKTPPSLDDLYQGAVTQIQDLVASRSTLLESMNCVDTNATKKTKQPKRGIRGKFRSLFDDRSVNGDESLGSVNTDIGDYRRRPLISLGCKFSVNA